MKVTIDLESKSKTGVTGDITTTEKDMMNISQEDLCPVSLTE